MRHQKNIILSVSHNIVTFTLQQTASQFFLTRMALSTEDTEINAINLK